ncbi:citrate/2-methylcitrate synthase [Roseburia sp. 499]|uniref:citrate/2-methylcitrate synthase n=1 Tax=Roseburia sp. 499 TaxID=1261634 RepID=UPI00095190B4|nr:citrate/2-methylcitrate synthase [Roseburia sp. 499]WVK71635.1 citrate/2-methylcitrate synthase [Roseburia sp. 499]
MNAIEDYVKKQEEICRKNDTIAPRLYDEYGVNCGLRDENGKGVLTGLTNISKIVSSKIIDGEKIPCDGELWYRGYRVEKLIGELGPEEMGFEKIAYLLLMGELPGKEQEEEFRQYIGNARALPTNFTRDVIMKAPTEDIMSSMTKSILTLASYDPNAKDTSISNSLRQCIQLISQFPLLAVYGYNAFNHYEKNASMFIHHPDPELSTAENILMMMRPEKTFSKVEAKVLDTALILHMEHGGGNNSTFTTRVVTSSGSDTYSTMAAAMCSLKGPKHGGANIKVMEMMQDIREHVSDYSDKEEVSAYLEKIVDKEAFDHKGLIYGMGHAVYSLSDPREKVFKKYVDELAKEKGREKDLLLYENIEEAAPKIIGEKRRIFKGVSPNVDFYSGFVYDMLGIPQELYTAMFGIARIVGWSAHRIEELICTDKIIRPAYMSVMEEK